MGKGRVDHSGVGNLRGQGRMCGVGELQGVDLRGGRLSLFVPFRVSVETAPIANSLASWACPSGPAQLGGTWSGPSCPQAPD